MTAHCYHRVPPMAEPGHQVRDDKWRNDPRVTRNLTSAVVLLNFLFEEFVKTLWIIRTDSDFPTLSVPNLNTFVPPYIPNPLATGADAYSDTIQDGRFTNPTGSI